MDELHVKKHLRHLKRYELNLFLKGIGLPLEEIFKVWRSGVLVAMANYQRTPHPTEAYVWFRGPNEEKFEHDCEKLIGVSRMEPRGEVSIAMPLNQYRALNANEHR